MLTDKLWEKEISFYIDAAGFQHTYNPNEEARSLQTMTWRWKNEGLHSHCTAKGSHAERVAHFIVATAHQKDVALCEQYEGKTNGGMLSDFIKRHFQETFSRCRISKVKRFLQDRCPVQNSKKAGQPLDTVGAIRLSIHPRSSDFNPIKNIFNYVKSKLCNQVFEKNIIYETFNNLNNFLSESNKLLKSLLPNILIKLLNRCQKEWWWLSSQKGK